MLTLYTQLWFFLQCTNTHMFAKCCSIREQKCVKEKQRTKSASTWL